MTDAVYTVAFTGHRPQKLGGYGAVNHARDALQAKLARRLGELRAQYPDLRAISGMALGFDQWAAQVCVNLGIPFIAAVPHKGQELRWPGESRAAYYKLLVCAAETAVVCEGGYEPRKMQVRNEWMVDRANHLIAAWDSSPGGTANCLRYANLVHRSWENLLPLVAP